MDYSLKEKLFAPYIESDTCKKAEDKYNVATKRFEDEKKKYNAAKEEFEKIKIAKIQKDKKFYWAIYAEPSVVRHRAHIVARFSSHKKAERWMPQSRKSYDSDGDYYYAWYYTILQGNMSNLNDDQVLYIDDRPPSHFPYSGY